MRYQFKVPEGQIKILESASAEVEQAKKKLNLILSVIVMGRVKSGRMLGIQDDVMTIEVEADDILAPPTEEVKSEIKLVEP